MQTVTKDPTTAFYERVLVDDLRECMSSTGTFEEADEWDEAVIVIKHANQFEMLPLFVKSFTGPSDWPTQLGHDYSATLMEYRKSTGLAAYKLVRL